MVSAISPTRAVIFLLTAFLLITRIDAGVAEVSPVVPQTEVQIEMETLAAETPPWKRTWERARTLARANQLTQAEQAYRLLLQQKPSIIEARWELCKLLMLLEQRDEAAQILEELLELEPDNLEYLLAAGNTALRNGHYSKSIKFHGQVYEMDPMGPLSHDAIEGMIAGFRGLGNEKSAFLLLEQSYQRDESDTALLTDLARTSMRLGMIDKARYYYDRLVSVFPTERRHIFAAAQVYDSPEVHFQAAVYWKKYLNLEPDYLPFHQKLAEYYLRNDSPADALPHLVRIYAEDGSATLARRIGDIYSVSLQRPDKALLYYEEYAAHFPSTRSIDDKIEAIRKSLAREYLPIVENNAAAQLWDDLDQVTRKKDEIFLEMAELLQQQQKGEQAIHVMEILHQNRAEDLGLAYRLAEMYGEAGEIGKAYALLTLLHAHSFANKDYLLAKAAVELQETKERQGLASLLDYLRYRGDDPAVFKEAFQLAGTLGLTEEIDRTWRYLPDDYKAAGHLDLQLTYIEALRKSGMFSQAHEAYDRLLQQVRGDKKALAAIHFHMADTLLAQGNVFDAEQVVRQALAGNLEVERALEKLVEISLNERQTAQAEAWLDILAKRKGIENLAEYEKPLPETVHFLKARLLMHAGKYEDAIRLIGSHPQYAQADEPHAGGFVGQSDLLLARIHFWKNDVRKCREALDRLERNGYAREESLVLRDVISGTPMAHSSADPSTSPAPFSLRLEKARLYNEYKEGDKALAHARGALEVIPESMTAKIAETTILASLSRYDEALEGLDIMASRYPEQEYFGKLGLQLEFRRGNFEEIIAQVPMMAAPPADAANVAVGGQDEETFFWKKLLLARALWAQGRKEESITEYESLLNLPVDSLFLAKMEVEQINLHLPQLKKSFWNAISLPTLSDTDTISTFMEPQFVASNIGHPVEQLAASMYGTYRRQQLARKELSARKAVEQHDYYRAQKEYQELLEKEKSQESLFDLAYVYSKLGLHGKAAELYELMKEKGPLYPGLDEYIQANELKRQPRISTTFLKDNRKGRDGYVNMKKSSYGIEGWLMPSFDQEMSVSLFRNSYSSYDRTRKSWSETLIGTYSTYFENTIDLNISFGLDMPHDEGSNEILYKFELIRRMNKSLEVYGRFEQDLVQDTMSSVTDSIIFRDLETGVKFDVFPRWFVGADFRYRLYSDDNEQSRYKLWTMYHLFGVVNQFNLKYSYENIRNNDENVGRDNNFRNVFRPDDRVYWSPEHYWQHLFTLHFKHFFEVQRRPQDPLSYCSFDYSYGYESDSRQNHHIDLNIFLEINRHYLLKGNLTNQNGDDYKETHAAVSLIYRW